MLTSSGKSNTLKYQNKHIKLQNVVRKMTENENKRFSTDKEKKTPEKSHEEAEESCSITF